MHALVEAGADIIELGVPFSDPMADGPMIQRASERALKHGVGAARRARDGARASGADDAQTPVVLMGYANPIEAMGVEPFADAAAGGGRRWRAGGRLPAGGMRGLRRRRRSARASTRSSCWRRRRPRRASTQVGAHRQRLPLLRFAQGRDGRGPPRSRPRWRARMPAIRAATPACRSVWASASATRRSARSIARIADAVVIGSRIVEEIESAPARSRPSPA